VPPPRPVNCHVNVKPLTEEEGFIFFSSIFSSALKKQMRNSRTAPENMFSQKAASLFLNWYGAAKVDEIAAPGHLA
jgi:hypothetical protein